MKICMIGTGYVGLVSGTCFADLGNRVYCVDKDRSKINKLKNAISPIYEPGLDDLIRNNFRAKRLNFTDDLENAVKESQMIFICVGTPTKKIQIWLIFHKYIVLLNQYLSTLKTIKLLLPNPQYL